MFVSFLAILTNASRNGSEVVCCALMPKAVWTRLISYGETSRRIRRFPFSVGAFSVGAVCAPSSGASERQRRNGKEEKICDAITAAAARDRVLTDLPGPAGAPRDRRAPT